MELESQKHTLRKNKTRNIEIPTWSWNLRNTHSDETKQETLKFQRGVGISETHIRMKKNKKHQNSNVELESQKHAFTTPKTLAKKSKIPTIIGIRRTYKQNRNFSKFLRRRKYKKAKSRAADVNIERNKNLQISASETTASQLC